MLYAPAKMLKADIVGAGAPSASLSPIEQQVVLISLGDQAETIDEGSELRRIWSRLFGIRPSNRLANPRLEVLRVFCVRYRLDRGLPGREASDVILSTETMLAAAALIDRRLPRSTPPSEPPLVRALRRFLPRS